MSLTIKHPGLELQLLIHGFFSSFNLKEVQFHTQRNIQTNMQKNFSINLIHTQILADSKPFNLGKIK